MPDLIAPNTIRIVLGATPGGLGVELDVYPDPRAAPSPSHAVQSMVALAIVQLQATVAAQAQRIAALEIWAAEFVREQACSSTPAQDARRQLAITAVTARADAMEIGRGGPPADA